MQQHIIGLVELLLLTLTSSLLAFILMDLFNRVQAMFSSKEGIIAQKDTEIQSLRETIANLESQIAQNNNQELSNFLQERGF